MKRSILLALALLVICVGAGIDDYLSEMKTTKPQVQEFIQDDFGYGTFAYPSACSKIPQAKRASIVRAVGDFAKAFTTSDTFRQWYARYRDQHKPSPPEALKSMDESRKEQIAAMKTQIAEQEKAAASAPNEQKALYKDIIASMKKALTDLENTDKSQDASMNQYIQQANEAAEKDYKQKLADFEREYPAGDPRPLVKKRLQTFLKSTENVDFNAKLVQKGKVMVFENPAYEKKDSNWKLAYRAGKDATQAARAFAQTWMKQL
jgi:flagellar biosynthesis GTPase FlhF